MKFVAISDTHGLHKGIKDLPKGDCIIHAGDVSNVGKEWEVMEFLEWFSALEYKYKIMIAGNHDFFFEQASKERINNAIPSNVVYLNDSEFTIEGIKIWGSPVTPFFFNWAFNRQRGQDINEHWQLIPNNIDILITHGPADDILDRTMAGDKTGCQDLLKKIESIKPKYHICGHIHEAYGEKIVGETHYINASILDHKYVIRNKAVEFNLK